VTGAGHRGRGGADGAEFALVIAAALYCGYGIAQGILAILLDAGRYPSVTPNVLVALVVFGSTAAVVIACLRADHLLAWPVSAYTVVLIAAVIADAALTRPRDGHTWVYFMYPVSLINSIMIGLTYRRLPTVLSVTAALSGAYVYSAVFLHHDPVWNVLPNGLSYPANTSVAWAVGRFLRRSGSSLDEVRAESVARAVAVAAGHARARNMRILHDRALQTLETLAMDARITDTALRGYIAQEGAWLRAYIEREEAGPAGDLVTALHELTQRKAAAGLHVELNIAQLRDGEVSLRADVQEALVDAAGEALTNVIKHAGVTHATIRAHLTAANLELTVVDHGAGFDTSAPRGGVGLRESISGRLAEAGGSASIESATGAGTAVRLTVPRPDAQPPAGAAVQLRPGAGIAQRPADVR
jgi:signal transduction histidine kinase